MKWAIILFALVSFTRWDGHMVWVNKDQVNAVQGGGQLGYDAGTMINVGGLAVIVRENVSEVVRKLRDEK